MYNEMEQVLKYNTYLYVYALDLYKYVQRMNKYKPTRSLLHKSSHLGAF